MAPYIKLKENYLHRPLLRKVEVAVVKAAQLILDAGTPVADKSQWAVYAIENSQVVGKDVLKLVLAKNDGMTIPNIHGRTDAELQSDVDALIDGLVLAYLQRNPLPT